MKGQKITFRLNVAMTPIIMVFAYILTQAISHSWKVGLLFSVLCFVGHWAAYWKFARSNR